MLDNALDHKDLATNRSTRSATRPSPCSPAGRPAEDEALAAGKRYDPTLSPDGAFMFGWLAGKLFEAAMAQPGAVISPEGRDRRPPRLPATRLGGLTPSQAWPPGNHPEGRCGMISRFDGNRFVLQTPDFICVRASLRRRGGALALLGVVARPRDPAGPAAGPGRASRATTSTRCAPSATG